MRARAAFSLSAGLIFSLLLAAAFSLRGAGPPSAPTPGTSFRFDWGTKYEPGQLATADQSGWGWTRRARAVVAAGGYGVGANSIMLSIDPTEPPIPPFPIALPPHGDIEDLDPAILHTLRTQFLSGTHMIWPIQTRFGWPYRCLAYWNTDAYGWGSFAYATTGSRPFHITGGVRLTKGTGPFSGPFDGRILAYWPLIGGLIGDTLAWGGVIFTLITLSHAARARRRRNSGRCQACGYDLAGVPAAGPCPECGAAPHPSPA